MGEAPVWHVFRSKAGNLLIDRIKQQESGIYLENDGPETEMEIKINIAPTSTNPRRKDHFRRKARTGTSGTPATEKYDRQSKHEKQERRILSQQQAGSHRGKGHKQD